MSSTKGSKLLPTNIPILCFSTTDWDEAFGSRQQLMLLLAQQGHRVLFVERQVGPEQLIRDKALWRRKRKAWQAPRLRQIQENLWLWQPPLLPAGRYYHPQLNQLGQNELARQVKRLLVETGISSPLLWLYPPQSSPLLGKFDERLSIYHCIENFSGLQGGIKRRVMQAQEQDLLRRADLVFTHAAGLRNRYQALTQRPITLVPSAANVTLFQSTIEVELAVSAIEHPRLGVMGTLDGRLDVALLANIFSTQKSWQLLLIGALHPERVKLEALLSLPNVHYLGTHPFERLPAFLNGMDAFLIPYVMDEMTTFISPIKLYEYLAVGKPIISTPLPETAPLSAYIRLASGAGEFTQQIRQSLSEDTPDQQERRRVEARRHTWENRLNLMTQVIAQTLEEKSHAPRGLAGF